ncbi:MAG: BtaA family protein [Endomicrobia bacterium]|nr:BtaA family protein [Endomicrobiia bacterium]MCL2145365.1 BtaA family protein [Endomicrobiia bacterium]
MSKEIQQRAKFDMIRYANCWEDAELLLEALNIGSSTKCISIASAGDNSLSLLVKNPEIVYAVDLSIPQIACAEFKKNAIKFLDYPSFLELLGFKTSSRRPDFYKEIESHLSPESKYYFSQNPQIIENGIINVGKFERYFQIFAKYIMPFVLSKKDLRELFLLKSIEAQRIFYETKMNNWRFKALFKVFFSRAAMGRIGRDKEFFKYVDNQTVSSRIKSRADTALTSIPAWNNPYLNYILLSNFDYVLPHFAREENFNIIKKNIDRLVLKTGTINQAAQETGLKFDAFNLSDIFEYMDPQLFKNISRRLIETANTGARFAYWNMLVDRKISEILPERANCLQDLSQKLYEKDKAFFYKAFFVDEVK